MLANYPAEIKWEKKVSCCKNNFWGFSMKNMYPHNSTRTFIFDWFSELLKCYWYSRYKVNYLLLLCLLCRLLLFFLLLYELLFDSFGWCECLWMTMNEWAWMIHPIRDFWLGGRQQKFYWFEMETYKCDIIWGYCFFSCLNSIWKILDDRSWLWLKLYFSFPQQKKGIYKFFISRNFL